MMVIDRMQILNLRYGRDVGDQILFEFAAMTQQLLTVEDRLFRWGGPALLAIMRRPGASIGSVRSEVGRIMQTKLEHMIQTPSRSVMIPITARWSLFPVMAAPRLMYQKLDSFAASPTLNN